MNKIFLILVIYLALGFNFYAYANDGELDCVTTGWKLLGENHRVCVFAFKDPDIEGITCYISQAKTGGISGTLGLAEDPSNFSISCVKTGEIIINDTLPKKENIFNESTSLFFKATRITRILDKERAAIIYLAISRHIIEGSPFNAISVVPLHN